MQILNKNKIPKSAVVKILSGIVLILGEIVFITRSFNIDISGEMYFGIVYELTE